MSSRLRANGYGSTVTQIKGGAGRLKMTERVRNPLCVPGAKDYKGVSGQAPRNQLLSLCHQGSRSRRPMWAPSQWGGVRVAPQPQNSTISSLRAV